MNPFTLYLILKLDTILVVSGIFGTILLIVGLVWFFMMGDNEVLFNDEDFSKDPEFKWWLRTVSFGIFLWLIVIFVPSTKQVAVIYVVSKLTQEETLDKIEAESGEIYNLFKEWLRNQSTEQEISTE